ncbi:MAG: 30S ribosomal protein S8 [Defluviitaleaceae bacterium]|nr:30S ribosomal protein S8 [Defluviitaleaceae bacterium]
MSMSDPIADMLTRIRNANTARHTTVDVPSSRVKVAIADILKKEGYVRSYEVLEDGVKRTMRITLKYGKTKNEKVIGGIRRISKPGLRVYSSHEDMPKVLGGMGIAIVSTNKGIITDKDARKMGLGGEVIAFVW